MPRGRPAAGRLCDLLVLFRAVPAEDVRQLAELTGHLQAGLFVTKFRKLFTRDETTSGWRQGFEHLREMAALKRATSSRHLRYCERAASVAKISGKWFRSNTCP